LPQAVAVVIAKPASAIHRRALEEENQITQEYMIRLINQGNSLDQVTQEMANAAEFLQELIESNYSTAMINEIFGISPSLRQNIQNRALNIRDITTTQEYIYTMFLLGKKQQKSTAESFINIQDIITRNAEIISHHR